MVFRRIEEASGYCGKCLKQSAVRRVGVRHWPHLILTILTAGLWAICWVIDVRRVRKIHKWRCQKCGAEVYKIMETIEI
jgi:hypothetical protein